MSDEQNPFAPPQAALEKADEGPLPTGERSIEDAIAGKWSLTPSDIIKKAWELKDGVKGTFLLAFLLVGIASGISSVLSSVLGGDDVGFFKELLIGAVSGVVMLPLTAPLQAGIWRMMIRRAAGETPEVGDVFKHFGNVVPLVIASLIVSVAIYIGLALLVLPGMYLSVAASLTVPLVAERGLAPMEAFTTSVKAIHSHFFDVLVLYVLAIVVLVTGMFALGIGLFWAAPAAAIASGLLYVTIFGWEDKLPS